MDIAINNANSTKSLQMTENIYLSKKTCRTCKQEKLLLEYYKNEHYHCKICRQAKMKAYKEKNYPKIDYHDGKNSFWRKKYT
jgi:hypothetical protein